MAIPIARITGQGIAAMALSVALLWGCWIATQVTMNRSLTERARILRELERLQRKQHPEPEPVSVPRSHWNPLMVTAG